MILVFFLTNWKLPERTCGKEANNFDEFKLENKAYLRFRIRIWFDLMIAEERKWNKRQKTTFYSITRVLTSMTKNELYFTVEADDGTTPTLRQLFMAMRQIQFDIQDIKSQLNQERTIRSDLQRLVMTHIEKCGSNTTCWSSPRHKH